MTPQQNKNTLDWVEAMLSGQYRHGKKYLYNPVNDTYSAFGVALKLAGHDRVYESLFVNTYPVVPWDQSVSQKWFDARFGTNRQVGVIKTMNDLTNDYFAVCALLLNSCLVGERQHNLHLSMMEEYSKAKETAGTDLQSKTVDAIQSNVSSLEKTQRGKE